MAAATWQREEASEVERAEEAAEAECWTEETEDGRRRTEEVPRHSGIAGATEQQLEEWQCPICRELLCKPVVNAACGRGLHSFTLELNLSNTRTHS